MKKVLFFTGVLAVLSAGAKAQEVITLEWEAGTEEKNFEIRATNGEVFTVDWGDGNSTTHTGEGDSLLIPSNIYSIAGTYTVIISATADCHFMTFDCHYRKVISLILNDCSELENLNCHVNQLSNLDLRGCLALITLTCGYNKLENLDITSNGLLQNLDCGMNELTNLDLSNNPALRILYCHNNKLYSLDLSSNQALEKIACVWNRLQLSDLYSISEMISEDTNKILGYQKRAIIGKYNNPLFKDQWEFNGIFTQVPMLIGNSDGYYIIPNEGIVFTVSGLYFVHLTNDAIVSHPDFPVEMIVDVHLPINCIIENDIPNLKIYPNPTKDILNMEIQNNEEIKSITIYSMEGKLIEKDMYIFQSGQLNINKLAIGSYILNIETDNNSFSKLIIKN